VAVVEYALRVSGLRDAESGLAAVGAGARGAAAGLDEAGGAALEFGADVQQGMSAAERATLQAQRALDAMLRAQMTGSQRAAADVQSQVAALDRLASQGADTATVERARALARQQGAQRIADALDRERVASVGAAGAADELGRASGRAGQGLASVLLQLPDVATGLASGQSAFTVFVQQGLQVLQVNLASLMPALAAVGPALAVVGTAAAALGVTYAVLADEVADAEAAMLASAEAATRMQEAHAALGGTMQSLADEVGLLTGAVTREELAQRKRDEAIRQSFGVVREQIGLKREQLALELEAAEAAFRGSRVTVESVRAVEEARARLTGQLSAYDTTLTRLAERERVALAESELLTLGQTAQREAGARGGRTSAPRPEVAVAVPVEVDLAALEDLVRTFDRIGKINLGFLSDDLAASTEGFERASRALARVPLNIEAIAAAAERATAGIGIAGAALRGNLGGAVSGLGAAMGGTLGAVLGPVGAALGVAQGIGAQAESQGVSVAEVTTQAVEGAIGGIEAVIEGLPDIISQTLPVLVTSLLVDLPAALVRSLPDILVEALATALFDLPRAFAEAIKDALTPGDFDPESTRGKQARFLGGVIREGMTSGTGSDTDIVSTIIGLAAIGRAGRDRAQSSRSASTARRASSQRSVPASTGRNPFEGLAAAWDAQYAGPMGLSPTTPQLRG
jgi:hypothetical protein